MAEKLTKSYKDMTYPELLKEEERVKILLITNHDYFTYKQNKKYLSKVQNKIRLFEKEYYGV